MRTSASELKSRPHLFDNMEMSNTARMQLDQEPGEARTSTANAGARLGDIVTIDLDLRPEDGFVPERLFDTSGRISLVLGWGNYLPGLHALLEGKKVGDSVENVSMDAGWGSRREDLILRVPKSNFRKLQRVDDLRVGDILHLKEGTMQVTIVEVSADSIVVDANPPLAGSSYACSFTVVDIAPLPSLDYIASDSESARYRVATFAMGCFWGGELAFMRLPGVVGTRVGYTQGVTVDPTYQEVLKGGTQHREAIMVIYDSRVVSYQALLQLYIERLTTTKSQYKERLKKHEGKVQYQHGLYYHSEDQKGYAQQTSEANKNIFTIELRKASTFYPAEDYHQQYLLKGGQSARKGAKETIRCFG